MAAETSDYSAKTLSVQPKTKVQVYTSELAIDPSIYLVEAQEKSLVIMKIVCSFCQGAGQHRGAECKECKGTGTGARHRVHHSRIARIFDTEGNIIYETSTNVGKEKQVAQVTPKKTVAPVDFKDLKSQGELWSKGVEFDHAAIKVEAHVLVAPDQRTFQVFNTYNGTLGKKGRAGKNYPLADEKAYERKISQLKKQGYKKR